MDTIQSLSQKINEKLKDNPLFYVTCDAERALGLEDLLHNYHIVCLEDSQVVDLLVKTNKNILCLEKEIGSLYEKNSNKLLKNKIVQDYIRRYAKTSGYIQFFKIAPNLELTSNKLNLKILNTNSNLNRKYELKISQYKSLAHLDINFPLTDIEILKNLRYEMLAEKFGVPFVIQFNRGHTGQGTVMINSKYDLDDLAKKFPERTVRISKYIKGNAYTLNACITKYGIYCGGISFQLTGISEATSNKNSTVGNDWGCANALSQEQISKIQLITKTIGLEMKKFGYVGLFGLDLVIENKTNNIYTIEVNARQPASIPLFTKLQIDDGQIPISLMHIAEFLGIEYDCDIEKYNLHEAKPRPAAQLFIRNLLKSKAQLIGEVKVGVYALRGDNSAYTWDQGKPVIKPNVIFLSSTNDLPLVYEKETYSITGIRESGILILCQREGKFVNPNDEIARIQVNQCLLDENGKLKYWVKNVISGLRRYIILKAVPNGS